MSYEPLHHKYRPQTFAHLVGQDAIATTLKNAILRQRIAPAYLFTGPRGTGKTSSARILAKSLNCQSVEVPTEHPCGTCDVCRAIAAGAALDVIEIDAASNTGVDNIREIIERAQFAPVQCRYKIYIIDECHMLSSAAFNALLKTLEEPPAHVVFVLATTDPQRVLPTIISRCQKFDFRRIPIEAMVKHLKDIANKETISITDEAITLVGQIAQGGLRDAESLLDQLSLSVGEVTVEKVWDLVGAVPERDLLALVQAIQANNPESVLDLARNLMDRGREPLVVLQNLASFYRDLLIAKTAPSRGDLVALTAPTWKALCEFAANCEISAILAGQTHLKNSEVQIKSTTQPRLWLEITLLGLLPSAVTQIVSTNNSSREASARQNTPVSTPVIPHKLEVQQPAPPQVTVTAPTSERKPPEKPLEPPTQASNYIEVEKIPEVDSPARQAASVENHSINVEQLWKQVLENITLTSSKVLLNQHGWILRIDDFQVWIGMSSKPLCKIADSKRSEVEAAFHKVLGKKLKVTFDVTNSKESPQTTVVVSHSPPPKMPETEPPRNPVLKEESHSVRETESNSAIATVIPAQELPLAEWDEDEIAKAARSLAKFFGGEIVEMAEDIEIFPSTHGDNLESDLDLESDLEEQKEEDF